MYELMAEGSNKISDLIEKGILLLGNTGSTKSTFTCLVSGIPLKVIQDHETGEFLV